MNILKIFINGGCDFIKPKQLKGLEQFITPRFEKLRVVCYAYRLQICNQCENYYWLKERKFEKNRFPVKKIYTSSKNNLLK